METMAIKTLLKGGEFLLKESSLEDTFIPEDFGEEQRLIRQTVIDFMMQEVLPKAKQMERLEDDSLLQTLDKFAALGFLGTHMPAVYGGMDLDNHTNTMIAEAMGPSGSFTVAYAAHIGIGMLPILYFGTDAQKAQYLPRLIAGELKAAYCLTEPGSGSDALAAKTRAVLNEAGTHYVLNGQKMWISNAGFADIFIVFAKIDGEKFTGFIVERDAAGLTFGEEEEKMGIKGSSTRQVFFENVAVPAENLLGQPGKGHLIAFNVLNIGRYKLGALCLGGSQGSADTAIKYANQRIQFGKPIASFGAIKHKLAEQAIRIFAGQSALYRVSHLLQTKRDQLADEGLSFAAAKLEGAEEYAIECSILKIVGSEVVDYVVDETLQIHGGMGFSEEGTAARAYRDSRINRIYEGTNEINRMLMIDQLFKRAMKGQLDLVGPAWAVQKELAAMPVMEPLSGPYGEERKAISDFKKIVLMTAGAAAKSQMDGKIDLKEEQEILCNLSDMLTDLFLAESTLLRVERLSQKEDKPVNQNVYDAILRVFLHDASFRMQKNATDALTAFSEGDLLKTFLMGLKRFSRYPVQPVKESRRVIAACLVSANGYILGT